MEEYEFKPLLTQYNAIGNLLKIKIEEYGYSCADGCCYNYGTITTVNDIELPCHNQDVETIVSQILTHLGYTVEFETESDYE
jgi:hypothetical protein